MQAIRDKLRDAPMANAANAGLVLSCFLRESADNPDAKRDLLKVAIKAAQTAKPIYELAFNRWKASLAQSGAVTKAMKTTGRTVIGLGTSNVIETGLRLHHTYGTPVLPGSALKGLCAHYCNDVWGPAHSGFATGGEFHSILFGTQDSAGFIVFEDAWMQPASLSEANRGLVIDVMTPHHAAYYMKEKAPTEFESPIPVPFLSVAGTFLLAVTCADKSGEGQVWARKALDLASEALKEWGIGGKTNAGYGRLEQ